MENIKSFADRLDEYHLFHAARGHFLERGGDADAARVAYRRAAALASSDAERRLLVESADRVTG